MSAWVDPKPVTTAKGTGWRVRWRDEAGRSREWVAKDDHGRYLTKKQAEKWARQKQTRLEAGTDIPRDKGRTTFRTLAELWLTSRTRPRAESIAKYRRNLELWVYPELGDVPVAKITEPMLADFFNRLRVSPSLRTRGRRKGATPRPISAATVERVFGPVASVLRYGVKNGYLRTNPAEDIAYRQRLRPTDHNAAPQVHGIALEWPEVAQLADYVTETHPLYGTVVRLLGSTGLRASELARLQIGDFLPERRTSPAAVRIRAGKTRNSVREVLLDEFMAAELAAYVAAHPHATQATAPMFPRRLVGGNYPQRTDRFNWDAAIDTGNFRRRVFLPAAARVGYPGLRLHDLRHTAGSIWLAAGYPLFYVSRQLGHASPEFTARVYAKELASEVRANAERLAAYKQRSTTAPAPEPAPTTPTTPTAPHLRVVPQSETA